MKRRSDGEDWTMGPLLNRFATRDRCRSKKAYGRCAESGLSITFIHMTCPQPYTLSSIRRLPKFSNLSTPTVSRHGSGPQLIRYS
jgi:hypothetical protein